MVDVTSKLEQSAPAASGMVGGTPGGLLLSRPARRHDNRVLAGLPPSELGLLAPHLQIVSLPAGAPLRHQDAPLDDVYFPHQGVIALLAMTSDGDTIEIASAGRGGAICPISSPQRRDGLLTAIAHGPLRASRIHAAGLRALLSQSAALDRAMAACREALLLQLHQNLVCCGLHPVEHRLARWLLETADRLESELVPATQEHVAQRLGVRRTTVTLLASKLQHAGAIRWGRSRIQILDRGRLETMCCKCYAALREGRRAGFSADSPAAKEVAG